MIRKIYSFVTPYYNTALRRNDYKKRPALIIGRADINDFNILPVSRVTSRIHLDPDYDIPIDPTVYPLLGLRYFSYVRIHKQTCAHRASLNNLIGDVKKDYEDLYLDILAKLEAYNSKTLNDAL